MNKKNLILVSILFLIGHLTVASNQAATLTVTNKNNSGAGSFRQAIIDAAPGDTINFAAGLNGALLLNTSTLAINKSLTIIGPGANVLRLEMDLGDQRRVIHVLSGTVSISGLSITGGNFQPVSIATKGGSGLLVEAGAIVTLNSVMIRKNELFYDTVGSVIHGIVQNHGTLTVNNSSITANLSNNAAGGIVNHGTLTMTNTTVSNNVVFIDSAGVGGVHNVSGTTTMLNCTIANNGGGGGTGGVQQDAGMVTIKNTLIANNLFFSSSSDVSGTFDSQGNNLVGNRSGGTGFIASDLPEANPQLGGLANNGGTTYTRTLKVGSPAINAGNDSGAPATDQRGVARPQGGVTDIGAYESGVKPAAFGKIVFASDRNGGLNIYTMNWDGTNQTRLTFDSASYDPEWSPDGTKIVFTSERDFLTRGEIYVMNADGSNQTRLTNSSIPKFSPSWSPDGSRIVLASFFRNDFLMQTHFYISTIDPDGTNGDGVLETINRNLGNPIFSQDGNRIIYSRAESGELDSDYHIYSVDMTDADEDQITTESVQDFSPALSPDGNVVAYTRNTNRTGAYRTFVSGQPSGISLSADVNPFINPPISEAAFYPAWSPDGAKLAYNTGAAGGDLWIRDADGTGPILLLDQTALGIGKTIEADWFGHQTPMGSFATGVSGTTSVTFSNVSAAGTTTAVPINPADAGTLPGGYSFGPGLAAYEITTTASYTAPVIVCLQVPAVTNFTTFSALALFHNEGGVLIDRTSSREFSTKTICATTTSLSPFAVAESLAPSAAEVSVGGRVKTADGRGIARAAVSITGPDGETRRAFTNTFGYYRFAGIHAGETYVISVRHKIYRFSSQVLNVSDSIKNADFVAEPRFSPNYPADHNPL